MTVLYVYVSYGISSFHSHHINVIHDRRIVHELSVGNMLMHTFGLRVHIEIRFLLSDSNVLASWVMPGTIEYMVKSRFTLLHSDRDDRVHGRPGEIFILQLCTKA